MTPLQIATVQALTKRCEECDAILSGERATSPRVKYCVSCESELRRNHSNRRPEHDPGVCSATVGAAHELLVASDLLRRGLSVFRSVSANCDCDMIVMNGTKLLRLEVTTGYTQKSGKIFWPHHDPEKYDVLAAVHKDGIEYRPPLIEWPR